MPAYSVFEPPVSSRSGVASAGATRTDRFIFLRETFSFVAFLFGPLWMLARRLWIVLIIYLVAVGFLEFGLRRIGVGVQARVVFDYFKANVLPRLRELGTYITGTLVPGLVSFGGWLVKNRDWLIPVAAGIGAIIAAVKVWTAVSKAFAVVQGIVNIVLAANPIGLVVSMLTATRLALRLPVGNIWVA